MNEVERLCRECGETWTVHKAYGQSWSLCPDCRPPEPTDEPVSREGDSVREKKVRFEKQCDCRSSASGPRLITSNGDATEQSVTFVVRVIPMACDRCDTPWTRTEEPTDE